MSQDQVFANLAEGLLKSPVKDEAYARRMEAITLYEKDKDAAMLKYPDLKAYFAELDEWIKIGESLNLTEV